MKKSLITFLALATFACAATDSAKPTTVHTPGPTCSLSTNIVTYPVGPVEVDTTVVNGYTFYPKSQLVRNTEQVVCEANTDTDKSK